MTSISLTSYLIAYFPFPLGELLGILGGGVLPGSLNPNVISNQKMSFRNDEHIHTLP